LILGWQGFRFEHPDDWAPVSLTGSEREGYVRLASSGRLALQIRWHTFRGRVDLEWLLGPYGRALERHSKRDREEFRFTTSAEDESQITYHWIGKGQGRGSLFVSRECGRVFFLEVLGARKDQLLPSLKQVRESFRSIQEESRLWSILGLSVRLPIGLRLEKHAFQAGKTQLTFIAKGTRIECTRWGFAEQLLSKRTLEEWSTAFLGMAKATIKVEPTGLRLASSSFGSKKEALVTLQSEHNQIVAMKASFRNDKGRPTWDWLA
jgi:hypothetical protein